eukprot:s1179_g7.t1
MKKYDVGGLCSGILAGLVSITAGCGNVECGSAVAIGLLGGLVYQGSSMLLQKLKIDDPVDASPVHGFCGIWGALAAGLFDWGKGFDHYHGWSGFGCKPVSDTDSTCMTGIGGTAIAAQLIMVLVIILWAGTLSGLAFFALKMTGLLRIDEYTEEVGMDVKQHSPPKAYAIGTGAAASPLETVWKPNEDGHELQVAEILERLRQHTLLKRENTWVLTGTKAVVEKAMAVGPQAGLRSEEDTAVQPRRIRTFKVLDNPFAKTNGYNTPQGLLKEIVRSTRKSDDEDGDEVRRED